MFLTEFFGLFSLSAFSMWGFLMAFFFNAFVYSLNTKRNSTLFVSSFVMMVSYTISDYFLTWLSIRTANYLDWALYDLATIAVLFIAYYFIKKTSSSFLYLIVGLTINSLLFLLMYIDVFLLNNRTAWIFWDIYTFTINVVDFIMIIALIVDRDFLGLHILKNKLISLFKNSELNQIQ